MTIKTKQDKASRI